MPCALPLTDFDATLVANMPPAHYTALYNTDNLSGAGGASRPPWREQIIKAACLPIAKCVVTDTPILTPLRAEAWATHLVASDYPAPAAALALVTCLRRGVDLGFRGQRVRSATGRNLPTAAAHADAIDADMAKQMQLGRRLGPFEQPPFPFFKSNPLGVVFKKGGTKPRVIHHLSWPRNGDSVNASVMEFDVKLRAFDLAIEALRKCGKGCFMTKIDIEAAYRCIPVRPDDWPLQTMRWRDKFYIDIVMQFGLASATAIFEWYSSAAEYMVKRLLGVRHMVHYIDDFLLLESNRDKCQQALDRILALFAQLGLPVSREKLEDPSTLMVFLGVLFDTISMSMALEEKRLKAIEQQLAAWGKRTTASREELQSLIGVLAFAAKVVRSGRTFLRRMIDQLKRIPAWANSSTQYPLTEDFHRDVTWWVTFAREWNGKALMPPSCVWSADEPDCLEAFTDACVTGYGAICGPDWFAGEWTEEENAAARRAERDSMPWKELHIIVRAAATWGPSWRGKHVMLRCDCQPVVQLWHKGDSTEPAMASLLRTLLFIVAQNDFVLSVEHISGAHNTRADLLSRGQVTAFKELQVLPSPLPVIPSPLPIHPW